MPRFTYSKAMLDFLRVTYPEESLGRTTELFNFAFGCSLTVSQIKAACTNHKITCGRKQGELTKGKLRSFTAEQAEFIKQGYQKWTLTELTNQLNNHFGTDKTESQIRCFTRNHGIKSGRTGRFEKGQESWNSGLKGWSAGGNSVKTRFNKGNSPHNHKPVGSERIDNKDGYVMIKVAEPRTWRLKHLVEWEKHNGKVPDGHNIWFIDNDRTNCDINNLMLVTTAEHAVVNKMGLGRAHPDAKETVLLLARIKMAAKKRQEGASHV